jgi:hypothetical protein
MSIRSVVCVALLACACQATTATPPPSQVAAGPGAATAPPYGTIATAGRLAAGASLPEFDVPCQATFYVGPFAFNTDPETVRVVTIARSPAGVQVCGLQASWVSGADAFDSVAGVGCPEGSNEAESEQTHTYAPGRGESGTNPIYLKFERRDPAGCAPLRLGIARR